MGARNSLPILSYSPTPSLLCESTHKLLERKGVSAVYAGRIECHRLCNLYTIDTYLPYGTA
jgi:hypothetical protein